MPGNEGTFLKYLTIVAFALGVVALGAGELHKRHGIKRSAGSKPGSLVRELHGDVDLNRAGLARAKDKSQIAHEKQGSSTNSKAEENQDDLSAKDRSSLGALIDNLVP